MNMTRRFGILSIPALALMGLALTADSARSQDDQGGGSFWSGGFGGGGGRGGGRRQMQMQQMGGEDDGSGYGGGYGGRGGGFGGGRGGRGGGFGGGRVRGGNMFPGGGMDGSFDGGMDAGGTGGRSAGQGPAADSAGGAKPSTANDGIPHFSEVVGVSPPPGFGGALAVSTNMTTISSGSSSSGGAASSSASSGSTSASADSSSGGSVQVDEKTRSFAQAKMKQFDKNNNGRLEKEEWSAMNDGEKYDLNKDGVVSLDEMIQYLSRPLGSDDAVDTSKSAAKSPSKPTYTGGRPGRYRSLAERYPDLSAKFFQMDRDGDGQIEMSEFSSNWTEQTVREFQRYDLNGDGIITPEEWLKAEPKGR